jgi:hypothetical protein
VASHPRLGALIFGLLACNTVYYIIAGRFSEALESVAWYALLILFVLETTHEQLRAWALAVVRGVRLLATLAIAATAVLYLGEKEWLDAGNLLLWITVIALLELEIRRPAAIARHRRKFTIAAASLFTALGVLVLVWIAIGKWMNAWDATLWLIAFGILELGFLSFSDTAVSKNNE